MPSRDRSFRPHRVYPGKPLITATVWILVAWVSAMILLALRDRTSVATTANDAPLTTMKTTTMENQIGKDTATFGSGCFWCTEAIFQNVDGVIQVESGYSGGKVKNPTYKEVCSGLTGHAEVIQLTFDPAEVSYDKLLEIFWKTHDPTTLNQQGADIGTQYRSVIFYHNEDQQRKAEFYKQRLENEKAFDKSIVTEIVPATTFYKAEDYHQNYYNLNGNAPYCTYVIQPKLEKFKKAFGEILKTP